MKNVNAVYLGRAIACTRLEQGLKRKDLVREAGISYPFLAEIENGKKWPSFPMLDRIALALACSSIYLLKRAMQIAQDFPVECPGGWCARRTAGKGCDCWGVG
jgi:transcriptional regulator with XRE-family HTH domain